MPFSKGRVPITYLLFLGLIIGQCLIDCKHHYDDVILNVQCKCINYIVAINRLNT